MKNLYSNKASISNGIAVSVMKQLANCYCEKPANILNDCFKEIKFPNLMKVARHDKTSKDNNPPIKLYLVLLILLEDHLFTTK